MGDQYLQLFRFRIKHIASVLEIWFICGKTMNRKTIVRVPLILLQHYSTVTIHLVFACFTKLSLLSHVFGNASYSHFTSSLKRHIMN